ncbi:MAG: acetamidase [SAR202 cluster bacterium]|nr:acetamidase [SAR202 cluster bacterium]|tara:strand:- start:23741 stop:24649 length:909 start_codon:yes stop_codon:yes gene_type:complete
MKYTSTDKLYFETGPDNPPTLYVDPGEKIEIQTQINKGPWVDDHPNKEQLKKKLSGANPSSGAIYINGATPGNVLNVSIEKITLDPIGYTQFTKYNPLIPNWMLMKNLSKQHKIVEIKNGLIHWDNNLKIPAQPMIGFVGVSPRSTRWDNRWAGEWGGNFDIQEITEGATVQLPINVNGALLHIGDMHAIQGDGEICGAGGIEAGGKVIIKCSLSKKPKNMTWPRITNKTHIMTTGQARPSDNAFKIALSEMLLWLEEDYGYSSEDAYMLLAQVLEARCTHFINPTFSYVAKLNKKYLKTSK